MCQRYVTCRDHATYLFLYSRCADTHESKLQWWYHIFYHALNISILNESFWIEPSPTTPDPSGKTKIERYTKQRQLHLWCMLRLATCEEDREQRTSSTSPRWRWRTTSSRPGYLAAELQWNMQILDLGSVLRDFRALLKISAKLLFTRKAVAELLSTNDHFTTSRCMLHLWYPDGNLNLNNENKKDTSCLDYVTMLVFGSNVMMEPGLKYKRFLALKVGATYRGGTKRAKSAYWDCMFYLTKQFQ